MLEVENKDATSQHTVTQYKKTGRLKHKGIQQPADVDISATPEQQMIFVTFVYSRSFQKCSSEKLHENQAGTVPTV